MPPRSVVVHLGCHVFLIATYVELNGENRHFQTFFSAFFCDFSVFSDFLAFPLFFRSQIPYLGLRLREVQKQRAFQLKKHLWYQQQWLLHASYPCSLPFILNILQFVGILFAILIFLQEVVLEVLSIVNRNSQLSEYPIHLEIQLIIYSLEVVLLMVIIMVIINCPVYKHTLYIDYQCSTILEGKSSTICKPYIFCLLEVIVLTACFYLLKGSRYIA